MVSIIPGIESRAPLRTETSSGSAGSPRRLPASASRAARYWSICRSSPAGNCRPSARYAMHAAVVMVNPGGTGSPRRVMSATFAPLPPSRSRMSREPSLKA